MNIATLRLFNAVQIDKIHGSFPVTHKESLDRTIRNGYILDPRIFPEDRLLDEIESVVGISGEKANAAFHKSWSAIENTPQEILWLQAAIHYFTTYGFEDLGCYQEETVYIPNEELNIPELKGDVPLIVVKGLTSDEILGRIVELGSGIALKEETLDDIMTIVKFNAYEDSFVNRIKNKELKTRLFKHYGIVPQNPVEFLRYLVTELTGQSLLIKNEQLISAIKGSCALTLDRWIQKAPYNLASIFYRYKPLFLAMKSISGNKRFFNQLRKQAKRQHVPLPEDYLNSVTRRIKDRTLSLKRLAKELEKVNIFRKIRLAQALQFRMGAGVTLEGIVYRVRNGKGWATDFSWPSDPNSRTLTVAAWNVIIHFIVEEIRKNVEGKTFYIPSNVHYVLPSTEKQFTGAFPTGSYVSLDEDMIVGVHWFNSPRERIDLDLSLTDATGKIGWDCRYTSGSKSILFSGDVTDAPRPKGASELFYLKRKGYTPKLLNVNFYNWILDRTVPTKLFVAHEKPKNGRVHTNYMVNPNNIVMSTNIDITEQQNMLGLIINEDEKNKFYFANVNIGKGSTSKPGRMTEIARSFFIHDLMNRLDLGAILMEAGANVVHERPSEVVGIYVDLSPNTLDKTSIIKLLQ